MVIWINQQLLAHDLWTYSLEIMKPELYESYASRAAHLELCSDFSILSQIQSGIVATYPDLLSTEFSILESMIEERASLPSAYVMQLSDWSRLIIIYGAKNSEKTQAGHGYFERMK